MYTSTCTQASQAALPANAGDIRDMGSIPASGRSPAGGSGNPHQCSCPENPIARGAWQATVHRVSKSQTRLKRLSMHMCTFIYISIYLSIYISIYLSIYIYIYLGEGNGNPLQYSCLENSMDRRAWWAAVHGVTESPT